MIYDNAYLFRVIQLSPNPVDIQDPLRGVVMAENLGVELAETFCLVFRQRVSVDKHPDLLNELIVRLLVLLRSRKVRAQSTRRQSVYGP